MNTPIYDFVRSYADSGNSRFHMPGHKGIPLLGCEELDITEIDGADVLSHATGIIKESEDNASSLFSSLHSFYSTEGNTLCIKAMLTLVCKHSEGRPLILAARNVHKAFIYAGALLDFDVQWMYGDKNDGICSCRLTKESVEAHILSAEKKPAAVYITTPDYLGNIADVRGIAEICDRYEIPLLADNAHGAYLNFTAVESRHPLALGATMCCDSAHKTLPVLTGGAYLHLSHKAEKYLPDARDALALHASTSPSYLILQSLDLCNAFLADSFEEKVYLAAMETARTQQLLSEIGFSATVSEPLKLTLTPLSYGYTGFELAELLRKNKIICEYCDREHVVLMVACNGSTDPLSVYSVISALEKKKAKSPSTVFDLSSAEKQLTIREAMLSPGEYVNTADSVGRICAEPAVSCPPAIPICISGEVITKELAEAFTYYGLSKVKVVK